LVYPISNLDGVCEEHHNAHAASDKEHDARHDDLRFVAVVIVLGQWIQCLEHEEWVHTKSNLGG
jgi:hypothetical protein